METSSWRICRSQVWGDDVAGKKPLDDANRSVPPVQRRPTTLIDPTPASMPLLCVAARARTLSSKSVTFGWPQWSPPWTWSCLICWRDDTCYLMSAGWLRLCFSACVCGPVFLWVLFSEIFDVDDLFVGECWPLASCVSSVWALSSCLPVFILLCAFLPAYESTFVFVSVVLTVWPSVHLYLCRPVWFSECLRLCVWLAACLCYCLCVCITSCVHSMPVECLCSYSCVGGLSSFLCVGDHACTRSSWASAFMYACRRLC